MHDPSNMKMFKAVVYSPFLPAPKSLSALCANLLCSFHLSPPRPMPIPSSSPSEYISSSVGLGGRKVVSSREE